MTRLLAISLALIALPIVHAENFSSPADVEGRGIISATGWLMGIVDWDSSGWLHFGSQAGQFRYHETTIIGLSKSGQAQNMHIYLGSTDWQPTGEWTSEHQGGKVAFLIRLDSSNFSFLNFATLTDYSAGNQIANFREDIYSLSTINRAIGMDAVMGEITGRLAGEFEFESSEWYGLNCPICPTPVSPSSETNSDLIASSRSIEIEAPVIWNFSIPGKYYVFANSSDWDIIGAVRLSNFAGTGNSTTFVGNTRLAAVTRSPPSGLAAQISGAWIQVFNDERIDTDWVKIAIVASAGGGIFFFAVALVATEILGDPLANKNRKLVYNRIQLQPGIHFRELSRQSGIGNGALLYCLKVLLLSGMVTVQSVNGRNVYYGVTSTEYHELDPLLYKLSESIFSRISTLFGSGRVIKKQDILTSLREEFGYSRATGYRVFNRLVQAQVLEGRDQLRLVRIPKQYQDKFESAIRMDSINKFDLNQGCETAPNMNEKSENRKNSTS